MSSDESAQRELVARAGRGDSDAWEEIYRRAYPGLFAFSRRRLSHDTAADDAVSETMTRAIENIRRFSWQGVGFDAWLFAIARNVVREHQRNSGRAGVLSDDPAAGLAGDEDTAGAVEARERADRLRSAFARLDPDDQDVLELRVVHEFSADETGRVVGKRAGAVRMAHKRALERLRVLLEGGGR